MTANKPTQDINAWIRDLHAIAQQEFGLLGWTTESLHTNFSARHAEGLTPYEALVVEGYEYLSLDNKKPKRR